MARMPTDSLNSPRFCGLPSFMRMPYGPELAGLDAAIIGLPSDSGGPFRTGARFAPNAVRAMSVMLRPINPYRGNLNIFEALRIADVGDADVIPGYEIESLELLQAAVAAVVEAGVIPCGIGGDHSVTLAELRAVAARHGPLSLIHFDSHSDTWDSYFGGKKYSAGTLFRRAIEERIVDPSRSIQVGLRGSMFQPTDISQSRDLGFDVVTTDEMFEMGQPALVNRIVARSGGRPTFLSFDMDFVDPSAAPAVQTPEVGGPSARETLGLLRALSNIHLVGCDVVEVNPLYDGPSQITALLAATIMTELLALIASNRVPPAR